VLHSPVIFYGSGFGKKKLWCTVSTRPSSIDKANYAALAGSGSAIIARMILPTDLLKG
jgi:hypothetical protein